MVKLTRSQRNEVLELAQFIIDRVKDDRLTRVSLLHLNELPSISGVYFATTENKQVLYQVLYIGKAGNLAIRCQLSIHHKLPAAIEKGATFLHIASVPDGSAWHVEQVLIDQLSPVLNGHCSRWWIGQADENLTDSDFTDLEQRTVNFLSSGKTFNGESPEIQKFLAFAKQHRDEYKAYYGLTITENTSAMDAFSRFCKSRLGISFKSRKKGGKRKQIVHYWVDLDSEIKGDRA